MKQTAVEWLIDQLEKKGDASVNMSIGRMQISIIEEDYINLLEQAKEIFEQQVKDAYKYSVNGNILAEQYYNETFNK